MRLEHFTHLRPACELTFEMTDEHVAADVADLWNKQRGGKDRQHLIAAHDVAVVRKDYNARGQRGEIADDYLSLLRWLVEVDANQPRLTSLECQDGILCRVGPTEEKDPWDIAGGDLARAGCEVNACEPALAALFAYISSAQILSD